MRIAARRLVLLAIAGMLAGACGAAPPPSKPTASAIPSAPTLPPGVLAEAKGAQGLVRVEERDGLRLLTIDGVVH